MRSIICAPSIRPGFHLVVKRILQRSGIQLLVWMIGIPLGIHAHAQTTGPDILVSVAEERTPATDHAVDRIKEYNSGNVTVEYESSPDRAPAADLQVVLGTMQSQRLAAAKPDSYLLETTSRDPLTIVATGTNERAMLYAAFALADLLKAKADLTDLDLLYQPRVERRFITIGSTTQGRRFYRPELYWRSLKEIPRYGYNGVLVYPGGGTPIGRHVSAVAEPEDGSLAMPDNIDDWKRWFARLDTYGLQIMMTVPPAVPSGYSDEDITDYYQGGREPEGYLENLKAHFRRYLELLQEHYPEVDYYMFNSTEGATYGRSHRFFAKPLPEVFPMERYVRNNEAVMRAYFDVLTDFFGEDVDKVYFWTHTFGITSEAIRTVREILFDYPRVTIIEDDFWNNNLWPFDLPAMAYLPEDLRRKVTEKNPFAMYQIGTDGEYYAGGSLPTAHPDSRIRTAREAVDLEATTVIQRLNLHDWTPPPHGTLFGIMEIVPLAASKQLWSPTPETQEIWQTWAARRFGKEAAPDVVAALQESETVVVKGLSGNGMDLLTVDNQFLPRLWMRDGSGVTRFYLFGQPGERLLKKDYEDLILSKEYTVYQMDTHTLPIREFQENQQEAMDAALRGLARIETARPHLSEVDYRMLTGVFENGVNVLKAVRLVGEAAYATNITLSNFDDVSDPGALHRKAIADLGAYLEEGKLSRRMTNNLEQIRRHYDRIGREAARR